MAGRKILTGPSRRIGDAEGTEWRERYDLMRRLTRLPRRIDRRLGWHMPVASSVTKTMQVLRRG